MNPLTNLGVKFEKAIHLLTEYFPVSDTSNRKPYLFHSIRVGVYLYENGYSEDIILAGLLHDTLEWSETAIIKLKQDYGENVTTIVSACTKNLDIEKENRNEDMVIRCIEAGQDALIVKVADLIDSFKWYTKLNNTEQLEGHCKKNATLIFKLKPDSFNDKIFDELKGYFKT